MNDTPTVRVSGPADMLAVVPRLLGFHPSNSLVVVGAKGPRVRVELGFRYDLPDDQEIRNEIAEHARAVLADRHITTVIAVGYGPGERVTPLVDALRDGLDGSGMELFEAIRVEDGRYWSYTCEDPACCPPEGVPFDTQANHVSAEMAVAGLTAMPDREVLAATLAGPTGAALTEAGQVTRRVATRLSRMSPASRTRDGLDRVQRAITGYRDGNGLASLGAITALALHLLDIRVRDDAWSRMIPEHREAHVRLWTDVVRVVDPAIVAPAASLLAFCLWQSGDGSLANVATDRALATDPGYSMALLLRDILSAGVPPSQARVPMTPEEVAESYTTANGDHGMTRYGRGAIARARHAPADRNAPFRHPAPCRTTVRRSPTRKDGE